MHDHLDCFDPRPREGATRRSCRHRGIERFDPRPREGATEADDDGARHAPCFDPRPREGATRDEPAKLIALQCFDPRPREGATRDEPAKLIHYSVSIRAPVLGWREPAIWRREARVLLE